MRIQHYENKKSYLRCQVRSTQKSTVYAADYWALSTVDISHLKLKYTPPPFHQDFKIRHDFLFFSSYNKTDGQFVIVLPKFKWIIIIVGNSGCKINVVVVLMMKLCNATNRKICNTRNDPDSFQQEKRNQKTTKCFNSEQRHAWVM